jgi:prevent-host-death family protein
MEDEYKATITATELKSNLGKYLDYVCEDHEVVITKNGKKVIRLTPYITDVERYFTVKERSPDYQYGGKKVSYDEFMEIYERSDLRMEFINGEIVLLSSPDSFHQDIVGNMHVIFRNYLRGKPCKVFLAPFDVHFYKQGIRDPDVCQPDLIITCDHATTINENGRYMGTPSLTVEILSRSTRSRDMVDKLNTYMTSGVREYWIVDPGHRTVLVYGFKDYAIESFTTYKNEEKVRSCCFEGLEAPLAEIFAS